MTIFTKEADLKNESGFILYYNIAQVKKYYNKGEFMKQNMT